MSLPPAMTDMLLDWVRGGGTLIAAGPAGRWNEFGEADGKLLNKAFGPMEWIFDRTKNTWSAKFSRLPATWRSSGADGFWAGATYGQGAVHLTNATHLGEAELGEIGRLVSEISPPLCSSRGRRIQLTPRQGPGALHLCALNPDCYAVVEDEITVRGPYQTVTDLDSNGGFPIPAKVEDGQTRFRLRLAPAEGIVVRLGR